ncbi:MAG: hypothetical protein V7K47_13590 [Nostoc sp.]
MHLYIALSAREGTTIDGYLDDYGWIIYTTAKIVVGASEEFTFNRTFE